LPKGFARIAETGSVRRTGRRVRAVPEVQSHMLEWLGRERLARSCARLGGFLLALASLLTAPSLVGAAPRARFSPEHAVSPACFGEMTWSADGRRLAFVVAAPDTNENATNYDLYLADFARHSVRRLTRQPRGDSGPSF